MRGAALVLYAGLIANAAAAVPGLEPGVPRDLAQWRAKNYRDIRYSLKLLLTPGASALQGTASVEVTLPQRVPALVLDWRPSPASHVSRLRVNGRRAVARVDREVDLLPVDRQALGRLDPEAHLRAVGRQDHHFDVVADHDALIRLSSQYQQFVPPCSSGFSEGRAW